MNEILSRYKISIALLVVLGGKVLEREIKFTAFEAFGISINLYPYPKKYIIQLFPNF